MKKIVNEEVIENIGSHRSGNGKVKNNLGGLFCNNNVVKNYYPIY